MTILVFSMRFYNYYVGIVFGKESKDVCANIALAHQLLINYFYKLPEVLNLEVISTGQ